jgi:hypothetical protein
MKFTCEVSKNGLQYYIVSPIIIGDFFLLMDTVANSFGTKPEFISMPEAEIVRITISDGRVYAKFDFDYGIEIECSGFSLGEIVTFENVLSKH